MAKYLNPKSDVTFKKVFGEHKDLLISFLNALLPLAKGNPVVSLEYQQPELVPDTPTKKDSIVDVRCTDKVGRQFIVEMQMYWTNAFIKRAMLNTCKAYSMPAGKGEKYTSLKPVYTLSLVNDIAFPKQEGYYHCYKMTDQDNSEMSFDELIMVFVELPKFVAKDVQEKKMQVLWLRYLTEIDEKTKTAPESLLKDKVVSKALELLEESAYTDAELLYIDKYWDAVSREKTALDEKYELGEAKGRAEGRAEGIEIGEARATERERQKAYEEKLGTAKAFKALGKLSTAEIAAATGLATSEVEAL